MNAVLLELMTQIMDQRINSALYVKVLKWLQEFSVER